MYHNMEKSTLKALILIEYRKVKDELNVITL